MTRDDIIRLIESNELTLHGDIEHFAHLVAAAEREACAKVLDEMADDMAREMEPSTAIAYVRSKAAAIRARGDKP